MDAPYFMTLGILAGFLAFCDIALYILAIFGRDYRFRKTERTVPNRATWIIWACIGTILAASYYQSGATDTVWFPTAYAIGFLFIAVLSIKYGEGGYSITDCLCLIGAALAAITWWAFNSPQIALFATVTIDTLGAVPTIKKSWIEPWKENKLAWTFSALGSVLNLLAIDWSTATFAIIIYPIAICIAILLITIPLFLSHRRVI